MNVDSSSTTTSSSKTSQTSTSPAKSQDAKGENDKSFQEEMKVVSSATDKEAKDDKDAVDGKENSKNPNLSNDPNNANMYNGSINFTDFKYSMHQDLLARNLQDLTNTRTIMQGFDASKFSDMSTSVNYSEISMSEDDAVFFANLVQNTDMSMQSIASQIQQEAEFGVQAAQKTAQVSATLLNALSESMKTNQPIRIDFDKDVSVIIRIDKDGSISANFIPGDKAVEQYLKNNMSFLKQRFDDQDLAYNELTYSRSKQDQQEEKQKRNSKENSNE